MAEVTPYRQRQIGVVVEVLEMRLDCLKRQQLPDYIVFGSIDQMDFFVRSIQSLNHGFVQLNPITNNCVYESMDIIYEKGDKGVYLK